MRIKDLHQITLLLSVNRRFQDFCSLHLPLAEALANKLLVWEWIRDDWEPNFELSQTRTRNYISSNENSINSKEF